MQAARAPLTAGNTVQTGRLLSLDVFRGGTIAAMILVNNNGSDQAYAPLLHAEWHGWTFTDLVFPFFLWIVGAAMTLSFARRVERGANPHTLLMHAVRRSALIFLIGLLLNGFPRYDLSTIRIPGVLQRIAVCYLCASAIFLYFGTRARIAITAALLAVYWICMKTVPVPGCGAGSMEVDCNFARWIDSMFLYGHMWSESRTWDPEGIFSTLPAIATTLFGIFAGQILSLRRTAEEKASWLFLTGNVLIFTGLVLSTWMPINKKLWTTPYSVFTAGLAFAVFASCYWVVDVRRWRRFTKPFAIYGMNALAVYIFSGLFARLISMIRFGGGESLRALAWRHVFEPLGSPPNASLAYSLSHVLVCFAVAWFLYRRNWFFRV